MPTINIQGFIDKVRPENRSWEFFLDGDRLNTNIDKATLMAPLWINKLTFYGLVIESQGCALMVLGTFASSG